MSLHKLTAGDGYTYLTRQVAASDGTERGYTSLGDYYAAKGESPGPVVGPRPGIAGHRRGGQREADAEPVRAGHPPGRRTDHAERYAAGRHRAAGVRGDPAGPGVPRARGHEGVADPAGGAVRGWNQVARAPARLPGAGGGADPDPHRRGPGDVRRAARPGPAARRGSCPGSCAQQSRPESLRGRRVRPDVLPGEVGVHAVGGRPQGGVGEDRGRARRRGHQDPGVPADGGRVHQGRRRAASPRSTPAAWWPPGSPTGTPGPATRTCTPTSRSPTRCRPWTGGGSPWTPGCCTG